ncbi:MAG: aminotransferase class I/II-fold pyridoxal phosphate-dependent enzyme [Desulfobacterales bacterium]|nr:MAG: aminotransferase class I/II-fold pyridoxal phosphate-dependent enzyme [Desulfobacterales bacterium]
MALIGSVPRRCVNLPPGSLKTLVSCVLGKKVQHGSAIEAFYQRFADWLGASHVLGASSGRSAFQLALEALGLEKGAEIIFPVFTFPVMPLVAKLLGYQPVFCEVDPKTYNSGPAHIAPKITDKTGAVLATHLFGQPCPIGQIADLTRQRNIRLLEDCAHACGVRVAGRQVGTFGDIGVFSFAEGKNMPCFGGGAIATSDDEIAARAYQILSEASMPDADAVAKKAVSVWLKWLLTRPIVFGLTAYPALRLKLLLGQPLMDSAVGDDLLEAFENSNPHISPLSNLQAAVGLLQLGHIDAFNEGARRNAAILTEMLHDVPGVEAPATVEGNHIYVYYPLTVDPAKRDNLRHHLLKNGFDTKTSDMSDCTALKPFQQAASDGNDQNPPKEASILEICVYPVIPQAEMRRLGNTIRTWAGLAEK